MDVDKLDEVINTAMIDMDADHNDCDEVSYVVNHVFNGSIPFETIRNRVKELLG
jgi:hypothetical protein